MKLALMLHKTIFDSKNIEELKGEYLKSMSELRVEVVDNLLNEILAKSLQDLSELDSVYKVMDELILSGNEELEKLGVNLLEMLSSRTH